MDVVGGGKKSKQFAVRVSTMDADLEFKLEAKAVGRDLFELVCRTLGLREVWYFGLQFKNDKGVLLWLRMADRVSKQQICTDVEHQCAYLWFVIKLYPETIQSELIQPITRQLFYLQVKQSILNGHVYCPAETCVLLATYAVQAELGDYAGGGVGGDATLLDAHRLLPASVIDAHQLSDEQWIDKVSAWWEHNTGMDGDDAVNEYLKIAQDLQMYGVHYFDISKSSAAAPASTCWLGVSAHGVAIYDKHNRLVPMTAFKWAEVRNISYRNRKFTVKTTEANVVLKFYTHDMAVSQVMLDLCLSSHDLFLRRRQPDTLEVQQMRVQAKTEAHKKHMARQRLLEERGHRERLERELARVRKEMSAEHAQLLAAEQSLQRTSEVAQLLAEKARISEEEAFVLAKRASEAESEMQRVKLTAIASEDAKLHLERHARHDDVGHHAHKRASSVYTVTPLNANRHFPAVHELMSSSMMFTVPPDPIIGGVDDGAGATSLGALTEQIEMERQDYMYKSQHLQEQLTELRNEIDGLKREETATPPAAAHAGSKFDTMTKSTAGSAKARVKLFENMP